AEPTYIYHVINAWEEGDEVVMDACRMLHPEPPGARRGSELDRMLAWLTMDARITRWRFDLATGRTRQLDLGDRLGDRSCEFPTINSARAGQKTRYSYLMSIPAEPTIRFDGIIKHDNVTGAAD